MTKLTVSVQGQGAVGADLLNTFAQTTTLATDLLVFIGKPGIFVWVSGTSAQGDGGQGWYAWNATAGPTTSIPTLIVPSASAAGGWVQIPVAVVGSNLSANSFTATKNVSGAATTGAFDYGTLGFSDVGLVASFEAALPSYFQFVIQNASPSVGASADIVVANDKATANTFYGNFGINSSTFTGSGSLSLPSATYLYAANGDLVVATITGNAIHFVVNSGATDAYTISTAGLLSGPGGFLSTGAGGVGYGVGAGGPATQLTSRVTTVAINKLSGQITMFSAAGSATPATFTVTDTRVAASDTISLSQASGTNLYQLLVTAVAAGSFNVTFFTTGGTATDAPVINFNVIKGSSS